MEKQEIEYELKKSYIKNVYIRIENGKVIISAPKRLEKEKIDQIVKEKAGWIQRKLEENRKKQRTEKRYIDGEKFKLLGKEYELDIAYHEKQRTTVKIQDNKLVVNLGKPYMQYDAAQNKNEIEKSMQSFYRKQAEQIIPKEIQRLSTLTGFAPAEVQVKKMKSAWGNCSSKKKIAINYQLIEHTPEAIEYVIIHELCHLKEMNHSNQFWSLVESYMPNYKEIRKELK